MVYYVLFWHFDLFYFCAQFLENKKCFENSFYYISATSDALFEPIWHKPSQPANIGPQDVPSASPSNVPRTSPKDPI